MIIKANELKKYMELHAVDKVPVEVINTDIPECKDLRQSARKLAKRLVITQANDGKFETGYDNGKRKQIEAVHIQYAMYNSFKKSKCYIPPEWEIKILTGELGDKIINEYNDHGGGLEKKFRETFAKYNPEIQSKIEEAAKLLDEAEQLSEEHGLPFYSEKGLLDGSSRSYFPASFDDIFGELASENPDLVDELTGAYRYDDYGSGWQSSHGSC